MHNNKIDLEAMLSVRIGGIELEGYCPQIECLSVGGLIELQGSRRIIYIDYDCGSAKEQPCIPVKSLLNSEVAQGGYVIRHRRGSKGEIMDDILEEFNNSTLHQIRIPIITNPDDENTLPGNMKRAFVILKDLYDTELEPHVIDKINRKEPVDNYVLTVRKKEIPRPKGQKDLTDKVLEPFKAVGSFFSKRWK